MAYGAGHYLAVGAPGHFLASDNGKEWAEVGPLFDSTYRGISYGGRRFVAVSGSGRAAVSSDGLSWSENEMPEPTFLRSVAYGNGNFVAVGSAHYPFTGSGDVWVSPDGETWTRQLIEEAEGLLSVTFTNNIFVAGGRNGEVFLSADAQEWTRAATWNDAWAYSITAHEGAFLAAGPPGWLLGSVPVYDQFSDWREQGHFTAGELADSSVSGPEADPGGFGIPNLTRYALGLDPVAPDARRMPKMALESGEVAYTFGWLKEALDLTLLVEQSNDLGFWEAVDEAALQRSENGRFEKVGVPVSPAAERGFFRLEIQTD